MLFVVAAQSLGQTRASYTQLQLAQSYERNGNWERAVALYEGIYGRDSSNVMVFESLRRGYLQLKRYDDAIRINVEQLRRRPKDVGLFAQLGTAYARSGDEQKALSTWNSALELDRRSLNSYYVVANAAIENRMLDRAVEFYLRGRAELKDPMTFAGEIANLHSVMMNFGDATREYLKFVLQNQSQLGFVQSRMAGFTYRPDARREATRLVRESMQANSDNIALRRLYAWLLMEERDFDKAYGIYLEIDERTHALGGELYGFAERAFRERSYAIASTAYLAIINRFPKFDRMAAAKLGYARSLEESLAAEDSMDVSLFASKVENTALPSETKSAYNAVIGAYELVLHEHRSTESGSAALLRIGRIKYSYLFDIDGALATWQKILDEHSTSPRFQALASLSMGDAFLAKGHLEEAESRYSFAAQSGTGDSQIKDQSQYRLAEVAYFRGELQNATKILQSLTGNPRGDAANDALRLLVFIQENENQPNVSDYIKAQLYIRQRKITDAVTILQNLAKNSPNSPLAEEAQMLLGDAFVAMRRYADAISSYSTLISGVPESILLDQTQMKIATVYQSRLNDRAKALESYQLILEKYPNSIYVNEARKRIRALRGG